MKKIIKNLLSLTLSFVLIATSLVTGFVATADDSYPSYYGPDDKGFNSMPSGKGSASWPCHLKPADDIYNLDFENGFRYWTGHDCSTSTGQWGGSRAYTFYDLVTTASNTYIKVKTPYQSTIMTAVFTAKNVSVGDELVVIYDAKGADAAKLRPFVRQAIIKEGLTYDETTGMNNTSVTYPSPAWGSNLTQASEGTPEEFDAQLKGNGWTTYILGTASAVADVSTNSYTTAVCISDILLQVKISTANVSTGDAIDAAIDNIRIAKVVDGVYYNVANNEVIYDPANPPAPPVDDEEDDITGGDNTGDDNTGDDNGSQDTTEKQPEMTEFPSYYGTATDGFNSTYSSYPQALQPLPGIYNLDFSDGFICWSGRNAGSMDQNGEYTGTLASDSFKLVDTGTNKYVTLKDEGYVDTMRTALFKVYNVEAGDKIVAIYDAKGADATKLRVMVYQDHIRDVTYDETTGLNTSTKADGSALNASPGTPTLIVGSGTAPSKFNVQLGALGWDTYIAPNNLSVTDPTTMSSSIAPTSDIYLQVMITKSGDVSVGDELDVAIDNIRLAKVKDNVYTDLATGEVIYDPANPPVTPTISADSLAWVMNLILIGDTDQRNADFNNDAVVNLLDIVYLKKKLADLANSELPITGPMNPARTEDVYSYKMVRYDIDGKGESVGWYFTPKEEGNYQTVILIHGQGNPTSFKERMVYNFNKWVKAGYIEPMVVVIPEVLNSYGPTDKGSSNIDDFQYYIYEAYPNRFNALLKSIEKGTLSSKIDTSKKPYVAGFSMGGMAALHAGADYNTRIAKCGALSPGKSFYLGDGNWGFYNYASDIYFSKDSDALVYLSAGAAEADFSNIKGAFVDTINMYESGIKVNNADIITKFIAPESWGGHGWDLAQMEIFMFLHMASYGRLPTNELVEKVCSQPYPSASQVPTIVTDPTKEHT